MRELKATVVLALAGLLFYTSGVAKAEQHQPSWGYGHIGGILCPHGWGSISFDNVNDNLDLTSKFAGGIHLSGYWILNKNLHLGAYFNYVKGTGEIEGTVASVHFSQGTDLEHFGVGASVKAGGMVSNRIWLGLVGDFGYYALAVDKTDDTYDGFEISPRFHMDVFAFGAGEFKMGFFASIGPSFVPYFKGTILGTDFKAWLITIQIRFGLTFGA